MDYFLKVYTAILMGSEIQSQYLGALKVFFSFIIITKTVYERKTLDKSIVRLAIFFIYGFIVSLFFIHRGSLDENQVNEILLRDRYFFIEIISGIAIYLYIKSKELKDIKQIILISIIINLFMIAYQIGTRENAREISGLFSEPSSAAMFYIFLLPLLFFFFAKKFSLEWFLTRAFIISAYFIRSKALYIVLILYGAYNVFKSKNLMLRISLVFTLLFFLVLQKDVIMIIWEQVGFLFADKTIYNLQDIVTSTVITDSFMARTSSLVFSINQIISNPLGYGFGLFDPLFKNMLSQGGYLNLIVMGEMHETAAGFVYATPKAYMTEIIFSTGIIGSYVYLSIAKEFHRLRYNSALIFHSFILLTIISMFVQLAPFFIYLGFLIALIKNNKIREIIYAI